MDDRPLFSVILPVYKAEATLRRAIRSLQDQDETRWEAIPVDDGSPDESRRIVAALAAEDPRVRPLSLPENRGTHVARKTGVAAARGERILFLDPDDEFLPGVLSRWRDRLAAAPVDLLRFAFAYRDAASIDEETRRFHAEKSPSGRTASGPGCALPVLFTGRNESLFFCFLCRADVCRRAFAATSDERLVYTEDVYEIFAMAAAAESYAEDPEPAYLYDAGGITGWRAEKGRNLNAYAAGYFRNLGERTASFAALRRLAKGKWGAANRPALQAARRERRRVVAGVLPWEVRFLLAQGLPRKTVRNGIRDGIRRLSPGDRLLFRVSLFLGSLFETLRILPRTRAIEWKEKA